MLRLSQRMLRIGAVLCGVSALGTPTRCAAQSALSLDRVGCVDAWADGIERFVAVELGTAPKDMPEHRPKGALDIVVRCQGDEIEIEASERGASTHRRMDLSGTAEAVRSRIVALAIAGLVRELAVVARSTAQAGDERVAEPSAPRSPPSSSPPAPLGTPEPGQGPISARVAQLDAFFAASAFNASPGLLWGGGLRARALVFAPLYVALDGQAGTYARDSELGSARLIAGSAGARIGWTWSWSSAALGAGAGQRLGLARASARGERSGATGGSVQGLWAAPFVFATADTALSRRVRLGVDAEVGTVLLPVRGRIEHGDDLAVAGASFAVSATLGVQL